MTAPLVRYDEVRPGDDFDEFVVGAGDVDVSSIGGYPVRLIEVVSGNGTLKVKTINSGATLRTASGLVVGSKIGPVGIQAIAGTGDGSSAMTLRVYK